MASRTRFKPVPLGQDHVVCDTCVRSRPRSAYADLGDRPSCKDCIKTIAARHKKVGELRRAMDAQGIAVIVSNRARDVRLSERPDEKWLSLHAEIYAGFGIVLSDPKGTPILPSGPNDAIRTAFRALLPISPFNGKKGKIRIQGRLGPLGNDRLTLLGMLPKLAKAQGVSPYLAEQVENVRDLAFLWEGGIDANDAFERLLDRLGKMSYKHARSKIALGLMTKAEANARWRAGFLTGLLKWSPLHTAGAQLGSRIDRWVFRELQIRTRADRAIGVMPIYADE
jgi:hypothetical protein